MVVADKDELKEIGSKPNGYAENLQEAISCLKKKKGDSSGKGVVEQNNDDFSAC